MTQKLPKHYDVRELLALFDVTMDEYQIAEALGVTRRKVRQWRAGEAVMINAFRADRLAVRTGRHPSLVWGVAWWGEVDSTP